MHPANPRSLERFTLSGAVVHGGGGKGGGGSTTTVQQADPWEGQQEYLRKIFATAEDQFQRGIGGYIAPFSPDTLASRGMARDLATSPYQPNQLASGANTALMLGQGVDPFSQQLLAETRGDYLNANPYLDQMFGQAAEGVTNAFNTTFGGAGRFGSPAHAQELAGGLGDMATQIYGGNYAQERDRQQLAARTGLSAINQAIGRTPGLDAARYGPADVLAGLGAQEESLNEAQRNQRAIDLARWAALTQGNYGGTTTTTSPLYRNRAAGFLGGGLSGLGAANMLGITNPIGFAGLGLAGGLLGLL